MPQSMAKKILNTLKLQRFTDWYNGRFDDYITDGTYQGITEKMMLEDIAKLFNLPKEENK